ncbi:UNVERIFIED_CONTAM: hypothetical protein GTU68_047206 [Idotea baltica]|nr:hypothetical protein [Idotea baltica]
MNNVEQLVTPHDKFNLSRIPEIANVNLRAWDAADELIINTVFSEYEKNLNSPDPILLINDTFGALSNSTQQRIIHNWSDSFISHLAAKANLKQNDIESDKNIKFIPATDNLKDNYKLVLIKIPKTLALLEDQLHKLKSHIDKDTVIIGAAMTKHIHNSTLNLFETIIGTTTTSRATKKARLIFAKLDQTNTDKSPYPNTIVDDKINITLLNHANVFSKEKLDVGTRFLIQNMDQCPLAEHVIDIGCGNGALGIMLKRHQPNAKLSFVDESYNAIASAKDSYKEAYPESALDANFQVSNSLEQFDSQNTFGKAQLVLCNPPFHQVHSIGDHIAWEMFKQSREALATDGEIWIVGNRHLGYHIKLKKVFGNCRTIASNPKFVILAAKKLDQLVNTRKKAK